MTKNTIESVEVEREVALMYTQKVLQKRDLLHKLEIVNSEITDLKKDIAMIDQ